MQSKTSFFNGTLFRKNLSRFWPLWAVYAVIWIVLLPMVQFTASRRVGRQGYAFVLGDFREATLSMSAGPAITVTLIFGALFAMAVFSYLCTARSVGMMHSFPLRREGLFITNYLSGLFMQISALALTFVLTVLVQLTSGLGVVWSELGLWLAVSAGLTLFFYSFGVLCAMFTGQVLAIPVFYGVLNVLVVGMETLVRSFCSLFLYGCNGGGLSRVGQWCSPVVKLASGLRIQRQYSEMGDLLQLNLSGAHIVCIYAGVGLLLTAAALTVYRLRRSESAGDTVAVGWAKPVFRYGVAVCASLGLGQGLYALTWSQLLPSGTYSLPGVLLCTTAMGLLGYFAAEMLLHKSFRVLKTGWKGAVVLTAALLVLGLGMTQDVTGFESRIPAADRVTAVGMTIGGSQYVDFITVDPALIARVQAAHRAIIAERDDQRENARFLPEEAGRGTYVRLTYTLSDGTELTRSYTVHYAQEELTVQGAAAELNALYCDSWVQGTRIFDRCTEASQVTGGQFFYFSGSEYNGGDGATYFLSSKEGRDIYEALLADVEAGRTGQGQFLISDEEWSQISYSNQLSLDFRGVDESGKTYYSGLQIPLTVNCTETLAALNRLHIDDREHMLLTQAQQEAYYKSEKLGNGKEPRAVGAVG